MSEMRRPVRPRVRVARIWDAAVGVVPEAASVRHGLRPSPRPAAAVPFRNSRRSIPVSRGSRAMWPSVSLGPARPPSPGRYRPLRGAKVPPGGGSVWYSLFMCDSLVAVAPETAIGATLFAKNSDRKADECQPFVQFPAATHPPGSTVRCSHIEIPQVAETYRVMGHSPWWIFGFEHGVNEHAVAIGNETVFSREPVE